MFMTAADYRESLRRYRPRVFVDGERVESVADAPALQPGINALGVTYDYALRDELAPLMTGASRRPAARPSTACCTSTTSSGDLLNKLEAVRLLCQETGCAQRYLAHDAFAALRQATRAIDDDEGTRLRASASSPTCTTRRTDDLSARHRDDRRQGRPQPRPHAAGEPRQLRPHRRAQRRRASSSPAPRRSSPARPTCTSSWSCRAAT